MIHFDLCAFGSRVQMYVCKAGLYDAKQGNFRIIGQSRQFWRYFQFYFQFMAPVQFVRIRLNRHS